MNFYPVPKCRTHTTRVSLGECEKGCPLDIPDSQSLFQYLRTPDHRIAPSTPEILE